MSKFESPTGPVTLLDEQIAQGDSGILFIGGNSRQAAICLEGKGTITSGVVTIEEAYYPDGSTPYTGTWGPITTVNGTDLSGNVQKFVRPMYSAWAVRVRISTAIGGGGTVTATGWAN